MDGDDYHQITVAGELRIANARNESITVLIRRRLSGELLESAGDPRQTMLDEGVWSINQRHELNWDLSLQSGEQRILQYRYNVLVDR